MRVFMLSNPTIVGQGRKAGESHSSSVQTAERRELTDSLLLAIPDAK